MPQSLAKNLIHLMKLTAMFGPYRAREFLLFRNPGRCPGLSCYCPLRGEIQDDGARSRPRFQRAGRRDRRSDRAAGTVRRRGRFNTRAVRATTDGKPDFEIWQTLSAKFPFASLDAKSVPSKAPRKCQTPSGKSPEVPAAVADLGVLVGAFPLSWSQGIFAPKGAAT